MTGIRYRPEIDGLRAIAVIPVILFHLGFGWLPGGYIGVDVFFVISGFLITSILRNELEAGTFSFRGFWLRRVRRILPAMTFVTAVTLAVTFVFVFKPDQMAIGKQSVAALLSVANVYFWRTSGDYWGTKAGESPLLHMWSLSVEEQFYLLFPIAAFLLFKCKRHWLQSAVLFVLVISLAAFLWCSRENPPAAFYLLPTRAWELASGCVLALVLHDVHAGNTYGSNCSSLATVGLCMVLMSYMLLPDLNSGLAIGVYGTALIIAFGTTGVCNRILSRPELVHIGKVSYSLYLWHWPILVLAKHMGLDWPGFTDKAILLLATYILAVMTYYLIEQPTRRSNKCIPYIVGCYLVVIGASAFLASTPRVYDTSGFATPHWCGKYYDLSPSGKLDDEFERIASTIETPERVCPPDAFLYGGIISGENGTHPEIVVLGDSHGVMWSEAIRAVAEKLGARISLYSMNGVSPFIVFPVRDDQQCFNLSSKQKKEYDLARLKYIEEWKPKIVMICSAWNTRNEQDVADLMKFLEQHVERVLLVEQPPIIATIGNRNVLQYLCYLDTRPEIGVKKYLPATSAQRGRELVRRLSKLYDRTEYIPVYDIYERDGETIVLDGNEVVYVDDDHLATYGVMLAASRIEEALKQALGREGRAFK